MSSYLKNLSLEKPNYDKFPSITVPAAHASEVWAGWDGIAARVREAGARVIAVECYPGVHAARILGQLAQRLRPSLFLDTNDVLKTPREIDALVAPFLGGDDPLFGRMCESLGMEDFLDPEKIREAQARIREASSAANLALIVGPGASLLAPDGALLIYADMPRWEGQLRQRRGEVDNLGARNKGLKASLQYKRSFFVDWRVADRLKRRTMARWDFLLDTTAADAPVLTTGRAHLAALAHATTTPFRVMPFFDPGPWGGQWMREVCALPDGPKNYAWCFDCVPEENSLLLRFGGGGGECARIEIPALNLVYAQGARLLGEPVLARFGHEFPIRFDFLDTMGGGNLSFQVHPNSEYAREHFSIPYTQDESYYVLDAKPGAFVYLGRKDGAQPGQLLHSLEAAHAGGAPFDDACFAGRFPAKKHDHFLIPSGTLHCSGADSMVLEISATPYIFTFKLWDWARLGLDGLPRPVNIARGKQVIRWERDETYARARLVNQVREIARGDGWVEERTGLHETEFIETRRHWFTGVAPHDTGGVERGGVNVLNLVEGAEAVVESADGAFEPFVVHYAETFIIPAAVGRYTIRPGKSGTRCGTMKAFVRH